ncbi:type II toxin-antitoxin system RelE/ParE family toxin [Ottowia testudinis]|uniref:Type II toxin-antitoxin system RelE/ParE family toxin n=1 Tax=Ottowia testudinis TaxID=2816950 RepID=A0A975CGM3_9BURK|nr:type II toxin-antitoxin system RelE/ParE family toxin [Ottowia testudinis]QTD45426.1 type II toxin-antitoxin system RelE/ParE family toxin [Ottowia testudinis]
MTIGGIELILTPEAQHDLVRLEELLWHGGDPEAAPLFAFLMDGLHVLTRQPGIGRPVGGGLRELIISRGRSGYLARYHLDLARHRIWVLRIRHQRESGYTDDEV